MNYQVKNFMKIVGIVSSLSAFAGQHFECTLPVTGEVIKVYDAIDTNDVVAPAVMVLSQPAYQVGNKTIAVLRRTSVEQEDAAAVYTGIVDHRFNESNRDGELFAGTKIKYLKQISISLLKGTLIAAIADAKNFGATLILDKRNGDVQDLSLQCSAL